MKFTNNTEHQECPNHAMQNTKNVPTMQFTENTKKVPTMQCTKNAEHQECPNHAMH